MILGDGVSARLSTASSLWGEGDDDDHDQQGDKRPSSSSSSRHGLFSTELRELFEVESVERAERQAGLHALWRFRRPFSFDHFVNALHMQPDSATRYPVLTTFIAQVGRYLPCRCYCCCLEVEVVAASRQVLNAPLPLCLSCGSRSLRSPSCGLSGTCPRSSPGPASS